MATDATRRDPGPPSASGNGVAGEPSEPVTASGPHGHGASPVDTVTSHREASAAVLANIDGAEPRGGEQATTDPRVRTAPGLRRTPLRRRTPLHPSPAPDRRTRLSPTAASPDRRRRRTPDRDWTHARRKVEAEGCCRVCSRGPAEANIEAAHIIGRRYDQPVQPGGPLVVHPDHVVPLCRVIGRSGDPGCHVLYDEHRLDLTPYLTRDELKAAARLVGEGPARRRITGWRAS